MATFSLCANAANKQRSVSRFYHHDVWLLISPTQCGHATHRFVELRAQEAFEAVLSCHPSQSKLVIEARDVLAKIMVGYGGCVRGQETCALS